MPYAQSLLVLILKTHKELTQITFCNFIFIFMSFSFSISFWHLLSFHLLALERTWHVEQGLYQFTGMEKRGRHFYGVI